MSENAKKARKRKYSPTVTQKNKVKNLQGEIKGLEKKFKRAKAKFNTARANHLTCVIDKKKAGFVQWLRNSGDFRRNKKHA